MHEGVYIGKSFFDQRNRIMILGESHHGSDEEKGKPAPYTSADVVSNYMRAKHREIPMKRSWYFFTKIAHAFDASLDRQDTLRFWECVAFGNYIDVSCGVKDGFAKEFLYSGTNIERLNRDLFRFANDKKVDAIVCVSKLVFDAMPASSLLKNYTSVTVRKYVPGQVYSDGLEVKKELSVFALPHPSGYGFKPTNYNDALKDLFSIDKR